MEGFWVRQSFTGNKGGDNRSGNGNKGGNKGSDKGGGNAGIVEWVRFRRVLWKCASPADRERERELCCWRRERREGWSVRRNDL